MKQTLAQRTFHSFGPTDDFTCKEQRDERSRSVSSRNPSGVSDALPNASAVNLSGIRTRADRSNLLTTLTFVESGECDAPCRAGSRPGQ